MAMAAFPLRRLPAFLLLAAAAQAAPMMRGSRGPSGLCDPEIVAETCRLMDPTDFTHVNLVNLSTALSASHKATVRFWKAMKFEKMAQHEPCQVFCQKLVELLKSSRVHLPDAHDRGCYEDGNGEARCDMELAVEDITDFVDHTEHDLHDYHAEEVEIESPPEQVQEEHHGGEGQRLDYDVDELAVRVANIFRIYPELKVHITERVERVATDGNASASFRYNGYSYGGYSYVPAWKTHLQQVNQKAQAYVAYAVRQMMRRTAGEQLRIWFGPNMGALELAEVRRVLNSVDKMLGNVEYVYPGPKCKPRTYAYVYPKAYTCFTNQLASEPCTKAPDGKYVFYICELTMTSPLSVQIETLTHEGSHHSVSFTDDVTVPWGSETAYGRRTCMQLARQSTGLALRNADNHCYFIQDVTDKR